MGNNIVTAKHSAKRVLARLHANIFPNKPAPGAPIQLFGEVHEELSRRRIFPWGMPTNGIEKSRVGIGDQKYVIFSSYSYLGLIDDERVLNAAVAAARQYGVGSHGVRALTGHLDIHEELERQTARFMGKEAALVFSSGYLANVGVISGLVDPHDHIFIDELAHVSLVHGCLLSGATLHYFGHNNFEQARQLYDRIAPTMASGAKIYVVTDSVFSMDGDLLDLPAAVEFKKYANARLVVDEAHGIGTIGSRGAGIEDHFDMKDAVDVVLGTFSKGIPATGGFVASSADIVRFLRYVGASPNLFSSPLSPFHCGAALESLAIVQREPEILARLRRNGALLRERLAEAGHNIGASKTPIVPLILGSEIRTLEIWRRLLDRRYFTAAVTAPAVALGKARLRLTAHAGHEPQQIEDFVECLNDVVADVAVAG